VVGVFPKTYRSQKMPYAKVTRYLDGDTAAAVIEASHKTAKSYERLVIGNLNG
jgi:hypothetical protein